MKFSYNQSTVQAMEETNPAKSSNDSITNRSILTAPLPNSFKGMKARNHRFKTPTISSLMLLLMLSACGKPENEGEDKKGSTIVSQHQNASLKPSRVIGTWKRIDPIYGIQHLTFTDSSWSVRMDCPNSDGSIITGDKTFTYSATVSDEKVLLNADYFFRTSTCEWSISTKYFLFSFESDTQAKICTAEGPCIGTFKKQ